MEGALDDQLSGAVLYGFVDTAYLHGRLPAEIARQLCDGGADLIQLRAKTSSPEEVQKMAQEILRVTKPAGTPLFINDDLAVAKAASAEGCHLGQEDFFGRGCSEVGALKQGFPNFKIGLSSHSIAGAQRAIAAGADYIGVGPVFHTATKPEASPINLELLGWAAANVKIPWFAIGGITLKNFDTLLEAGVRRVCVISAILNAPSVVEACREFKQRLVARSAK